MVRYLYMYVIGTFTSSIIIINIDVAKDNWWVAGFSAIPFYDSADTQSMFQSRCKGKVFLMTKKKTTKKTMIPRV